MVCMSMNCFLCGPCLLNSCCLGLPTLPDPCLQYKDTAKPSWVSFPCSNLSTDTRSFFFDSQGPLPYIPVAQCLQNCFMCLSFFAVKVILLSKLYNGKLGATLTQIGEQDL